MPYVKRDLTFEGLDRAVMEVASEVDLVSRLSQIDSAGILNYAITTIVDEHLAMVGTNYSNINKVIGVLECLKLELYRRVAAPYEDQKCYENGDVYTVLEQQ